MKLIIHDNGDLVPIVPCEDVDAELEKLRTFFPIMLGFNDELCRKLINGFGSFWDVLHGSHYEFGFFPELGYGDRLDIMFMGDFIWEMLDHTSRTLEDSDIRVSALTESLKAEAAARAAKKDDDDY